jgi:large subunit ribosomal protein L22
LTAAREDVQAVAKRVHVSARKARLVVDQIRGRSVPEARTILAFSTRAVARDVDKVLRSAVANGRVKENWDPDGDNLYVKAAFVDESVTIKRWKPRARGRVNRIMKRTCHITIKLDLLEGATDTGKGARRNLRRARKGGTTGAAPAARPKTRKKKEVAA